MMLGVLLLAPELRDLFSVALREQKRCEDKFPDDKPPWIEGVRWLVDDVFHRAHFPFGSGFGSNLKSSLKSIPAC